MYYKISVDPSLLFLYHSIITKHILRLNANVIKFHTYIWLLEWQIHLSLFFFWCHKPRHSNNCYLDLPLTCTPTTNNNGQCSVNLWRHCTMLNCCVICRAFRKCWALRFAWFLHVTIPFGFTPVPAWWTHNGLLVSVLNSRLCGPASGCAWGCYVVFLGQDIFTIIVSLHPSV